jgi:hypothetical protein
MDTNPLGKLDPAFKAKWVAALRSGDYQQGTGNLDYMGKFCCLGVACRLTDIPTRSSSDAPLAMTSADYLHKVETWWQSLPEDVNRVINPAVYVEGVPRRLSELNDGTPFHPSRTFAEIADLIEAQL